MILQETTFAEMLTVCAQNFGDCPAVECSDYSVSYSDLDQTSDCFAARLLEMGVHPGDHVVLRANGSIQWFSAFFGIIKAGCVAVLFNGNMKSLDMLDDLKRTDAKFILHSLSLASNSAKKLTKLIGISENSSFCIERVNTTNAPEDLLNQVHEIVKKDDCHRTAAIYFTAGSSGTTKPVMLSQYSIMNAALNQCEYFKSLQAKKLCLAVPVHRSFALTIICQYLSQGYTLCLPNSFAATDIFHSIRNHYATALAGSEVIFRDLSNHPGLTPQIMNALHACYLDGGMMPSTKLMQLEMSFGGAKFINGYNMTETCAYATVPAMSDPIEIRFSCAGKPLPGTEIAIVDQDKKPLPDGEIGEIAIKGYHCMNGYYKSTDNSQSIDNNGFFYTGDAGYIKKGRLYPRGRLEDIIHQKNNTIVPAEIERFIFNHISISDAKVFGAPNKETGESIEACIVLKPDYLIDEDGIRKELSQQIQSNQIPVHFFVFDEFPCTVDGKCNLKALKDEMLRRVKSKEIEYDLTNGIAAAFITIRSAKYMIMPAVAMLENLAQNLGYSETKTRRISHAVEEILTDRIVNAYGKNEGEIAIEIILMSRGLRLYFRDRGNTYDIEHSDAATAKIVMNMADNYISMQDDDGYPCLCLDFLFDKPFSAEEYLLSQNSDDMLSFD